MLEIWGKSDTILFIFAGGAAEFALNKAVDWLYYTGRLPSDPIGRLFSTVRYARRIVFAPKDEAEKAIQAMADIHNKLEEKRGYNIPDWAYRDVLFMLIHYSIAAYELLERKLKRAEKEEVFDVFHRVGTGMGLEGLPTTYADWLVSRETHLHADLEHSAFTDDLYKQYKRQLGEMRYRVLIEAQKLVVPGRVATLLQFSKIHWLKPTVPLYKASSYFRAQGIIRSILLPAAYADEIKALDMTT